MKLWNNRIKPPEKPAAEKDMLLALWNVICNEIIHALNSHEFKINFILAVNLAILGMAIALFIAAS